LLKAEKRISSPIHVHAPRLFVESTTANMRLLTRDACTDCVQKPHRGKSPENMSKHDLIVQELAVTMRNLR